jgi:hypothetical protein
VVVAPLRLDMRVSPWLGRFTNPSWPVVVPTVMPAIIQRKRACPNHALTQP